MARMFLVSLIDNNSNSSWYPGLVRGRAHITLASVSIEVDIVRP